MHRIIFISLFLIFFNVSDANENYFLSLKYNKVNVRYGPGLDYPIKFVYQKKNYPVQIVDKKENFRKIIDFKKNSGWIHSSQLKKGKSFILLKDQVLFKNPSKYSKPILKINKGRLLLVKKCKKKWCKVKTENFLGWIETNEIWGLH